MSTAAATTVIPPCAVAELPNDPVVLKRVIEELLEALIRRDHDLQSVRAQLEQLLRRLYGPRAERLDPNQLLLFAALSADAVEPRTPPEPEPEETAQTRRHKHGRQRPPAHLPRDRKVHELTEAERLCPCCGQTRQVIGEEVTEQYDFVPQSIRIIEHVRLKYACPGCEQRRQQTQPSAAPAEAVAPAGLAAASEVAPVPDAVAPVAPAGLVVPLPAMLGLAATTITLTDPQTIVAVPMVSTLVTAPLPWQGLPRCLAAPGLLAHVVVCKFADHLPLYRLQQIFARQGVPLVRSTMCDWLRAAADLVRPLYRLLIEDVLRSAVVQSDDTPVPVQHGSRADADDNRDVRLWVHCGDLFHPHIVYSYSPNHEQSWPVAFLQDYAGFLQADGYPGYDCLYATGKVLEVGCWAHARRNFFEAQTTDPARALYVLGVVRQLYAVEKKARQENERLQLAPAETWALRLRLRQEQSVPVLTALGTWLEQEQKKVLPKSPIGAAIGYALNQWQALLRYTTCGLLDIDNNAAERALRAVAVGRKNYLFFGSDVGGQTAAVWYSLVQSCKRLEIEPWRYLRDVLKRIPTCPAERLSELLPQRWATAQRAAAEATAADTS